MKRQGIALFDFDKTIAKGDSLVPFILYSVRKGFAPLSTLPKAIWAFARYAAKRISDARAKEETLFFLNGKAKHVVDAFAKDFYNDVLRKRLFPDAVREIGQCKRDGLLVLLVSASPDAYMQAVKDGLGVDDVIATRCALDEKDAYLGILSSPNCKGFEKTFRVAEYLAARGIEADMELSRSYGDSMSDIPMLTLTHYPTVVNGSKKVLAETAQMAHVKWS